MGNNFNYSGIRVDLKELIPANHRIRFRGKRNAFLLLLLLLEQKLRIMRVCVCFNKTIMSLLLNVNPSLESDHHEKGKVWIQLAGMVGRRNGAEDFVLCNLNLIIYMTCCAME